MKPIRAFALISAAISAAAIAQPLNSVQRYPLAAGQGSVSAPFCDPSGGPAQVSVWSIDEVRGHSGRGGGIYLTHPTTVKAAALLDSHGATIATLLISANSATVAATLAPGCYTVQVSAVSSGPAGGVVGVRVTSGVPPAPGAGGTSAAPQPARPVRKDDDS